MQQASIDRRRFLQGSAIALALPRLESLGRTADEVPAAPRRLVCVGNHLGFYPGNFFPQTEGVDYISTPTLKPLETHRNDLTVFSNLDHELNGGHKAVQGFLTSIKKEEASGFPTKNMSLDQACLLYTSPSPRDAHESRMPSSA